MILLEALRGFICSKPVINREEKALLIREY